jgi:hypothetical protein
MERYEKLGGPESYNHYAVGWAHAMNAPYQWTKQVASHWGGTRNGTIVHWPNGIKAKGEIRSQFHHVIDVAPTILEAAGLPEPVSVNGIQQRPIEGVSMLYSFNDANAAERHETQYFEMFGNRGIYHKGWTAVTKHGTPWVLMGRKTVALDDDVWELYDTTKDWSQANDLSKQMPEKLHELQRLWLIEATRYNVLPIDDRVVEKMNPDTAGRPVLIKGTTQLLFGGMGRLSENCVLNIKNKSHSVGRGRLNSSLNGCPEKDPVPLPIRVAASVVVLPFVMRFYLAASGSKGSSKIHLWLVPWGLGPWNEGFAEWAGTGSWSTGSDMPVHALPPETFGPCAIAGERLMAAATAKAVAPHRSAFISDHPAGWRWSNQTLDKLPISRLIFGMAHLRSMVFPEPQSRSGGTNSLPILERCVSRSTHVAIYVRSGIRAESTRRSHSSSGLTLHSRQRAIFDA